MTIMTAGEYRIQKNGAGTGAALPWAKAAAGWFVAAAAVGTILRVSFAVGTTPPLPFGNLLHAHSHIALFGWMGSALTGLFYAVLPAISGRSLKKSWQPGFHYKILQYATAGALIAFLWQGYAGFSVAFCTIHVLLWYFFAFVLRHQFPREVLVVSPALRLMKLAITGLLLSSLGTWALPFIMMHASPSAELLKTMSLDFFLHMFADGWLLPAVLGLLLAVSGTAGTYTNTTMKHLRANLLLYIPAVLLSSLRSTAHTLSDWIYIPAVGAGLLLGAIHLHFVWIFRKEFRQPLLYAPALFLLLKAFLECAPTFLPGHNFWEARPVLIAYLHIKMLGIGTLGLLATLGIVCPFRHSIGIYTLFGGGVSAMVASLLLLCLPALPVVYQLLPDSIAHLLLLTGRYGALAASLVLLVAGALLLASYLISRQKELQNGRFSLLSQQS